MTPSYILPLTTECIYQIFMIFGTHKVHSE